MKLENYQLRSVDFILNNPTCALWIDCGLGKTIITLTALKQLFDQFEIAKVLVIAPLRVATDTWPEEMVKWAHLKGLTYQLIRGTSEDRVRQIHRDANIYIINRENIPWLVENTPWKFDTVVIDESSSFKSQSSQRFKALKAIVKKGKIERMIQLTGTPISNGLLDIWAQIYLLDQGQRLGRTFTEFRKNYFESDYQGWSWDLREGAEKTITEKVKSLCLRLSAEDYLDLPDKVFNNVSVDLPQKVYSKYKELEKEFLIEINSSGFDEREFVDNEFNKEVVASNAAVLSGKLKQFTNGAVYHEDRSWTVLHDKKLEALESVIEENSGQSVMVVYNFITDWLRIKKKFPKAKNVKEKDAISSWNNGETKILCAHPASAGHGLNLQFGGSILAWFGLPWSLELYLQTNARLHRKGQEKPVFIHHIVARDTIEENVAIKLAKKKKLQTSLLEGVK